MYHSMLRQMIEMNNPSNYKGVRSSRESAGLHRTVRKMEYDGQSFDLRKAWWERT